MVKFKLSFIALLFVQMLEAQAISPMVLNSSGSVFQNSSNILEWSLGEFAVSTLTSTDNLLTQGFLQPSAGIVSIEDIFNKNRFLAFPNPASDELILQTDISDISIVLIHDLSGKFVFQTNFQQHIDLHHINSGMYIISLFDTQKNLLHSFTINKM